MSSVSWYFFMSSFMLSLHLFFGRPLLLLPETSSHNDFAHAWLGSRLKQWPTNFSLLFFGKSFNRLYVCLFSDVFISDVVFPLAHLNILISAEFSLLSSFFLTAQHHCWSDGCFEDFVFQCHGHLPVTHYTGYFFALHPSDSDPIVYISP